MSSKKLDVNLRDDSLSHKNLQRIKWFTTIAIIGFPIMVQILGAMMLFSKQYPVLMSAPVLVVYTAVMSLVIGSGIYAVSNRIFLRFSGVNGGLQEWETKTQIDAFAFSYRIIVKGVILAFVAVSALGVLQLLNLVGWIDVDFSQSIALNSQGLAALALILTYLVLLLPTLYIAWTLTPLNAEDLGSA